ncbi:hypothetical protein C0J52_10118 [Blattella germanica]|nr:hypothetical protein C0J52_10118 [Blattella germanica]
MWHMFPKLYLDLEFVGAKLKYTGPGDVLVDYKKYNQLITNGGELHKAILRDFERFVQKHGLDLHKYHDMDIIQCALQEPRQSHVYKEALKIAKERPNKLYLEFLVDQDTTSQPQTLLVKQEVFAACFTAEEKKILVTNGNGLIHLWDADYAQILCTFYGHSERILHLELSPDGNHFLSCSEDCTVKLWNLDGAICKNKDEEEFDEHGVACTFAGNNSLVVFGGDDKCVNMYDSSTGNQVATLNASGRVIRILDVAVDEIAVVTDYSLTIWTWEPETNEDSHISAKLLIGKNSTDLNGMQNGAHASSATPYVIQNVKSLELSRLSRSTYTCATLSHDEQYIIIGSSDFKISVWDVDEHRLVKEFQDHNAWVRCLDTYWGASYQMLLSGSDDKTIKIWHLELTEMEIESKSKLQQNFDALWDGKSSDPAIWRGRINEVGSFVSCDGQKDKVVQCFLISLGQKLLSCAQDGSVKIWDVVNGKVLGTLQLHKTWVRDLMFAPSSLICEGSVAPAPIILVSVADQICWWDIGRICTPTARRRMSSGRRRRKRSGESPKLTLRPFESDVNSSSKHDNLVDAWSGKEGRKDKSELLGCVRLIGGSTKISASKDFSAFATVDASGIVYLMKILR